MKRILICASRTSHILNFHLPYIEHFRENGCETDVAAEGSASHPLISRHYDMRFVKNPLSAENLRTVNRLKKLIDENHYDMVYSNSTLAGAALRMALKRIKKSRPYCVHISHGYMFDDGRSPKSLLYRSVEKLTSSVTDALVVMNAEDLRLARKYRLGRNIFFIDGMGLCGDKLPQVTKNEKAALRRSLGFGDDTTVLLCVGELCARKNQTLLIKAFDRVHRTNRDTALVFAGDGALKEECGELVQKLELGASVRFLGQRKDVCLLYRSLDVLLSGALMEGLPFNVMEALHCGMPVIATKIKGHTDLIKDRSNGLLFDPYAKQPEEELAETISEYLRDKELQKRLKDNAVLDSRYYIESVKPMLLSVLDGSYDKKQIHQAEVTHL